jgi:hypothetical protein
VRTLSAPLRPDELVELGAVHVAQARGVTANQ